MLLYSKQKVNTHVHNPAPEYRTPHTIQRLRPHYRPRNGTAQMTVLFRAWFELFDQILCVVENQHKTSLSSDYSQLSSFLLALETTPLKQQQQQQQLQQKSSFSRVPPTLLTQTFVFLDGFTQIQATQQLAFSEFGDVS